MADKVPVKAIYTGSDVTSLGEYTSSDTIAASYINGLAGEVTGTGGATVVADNIIDEANLKVSNNPTNGYVLTAQSGNTGGLTWAADSTTDSTKLPLAGGTMTGPVVADTDTDATNTGTVTLDFSASQNFVLTLTGAVTLANPTTETVGQSGFITFIQDGTGGRLVSLGNQYYTAGTHGLTLTSTANAIDVVPYIVAAASKILLGTPQLAFVNA